MEMIPGNESQVTAPAVEPTPQPDASAPAAAAPQAAAPVEPPAPVEPALEPAPAVAAPAVPAGVTSGQEPAPPLSPGASFVERARALRYSDTEIEAYLAPKMLRARELGYSQDEINNYWGIKAEPAPTVPAAFVDRLKRGNALLELAEKFGDGMIKEGDAYAGLGRIIEAVGGGAKEGFGEGTLGLDRNEEFKKQLQDAGLITSPDKPVTPLLMLMEGMIRPFGVGADLFLRGGSAAVTGAAAGFGQLVGEVTGDETQQGQASRAVVDLANALMPVIGDLHAMRVNAPPEFAKVSRGADGTTSRPTIGGLPMVRDFDTAAGVVGQGADSARIKDKLDALWNERGIHPSEVPHDAARDVTIGQDLVSTNRKIPEAYGGDVEPAAVGPATEDAPNGAYTPRWVRQADGSLEEAGSGMTITPNKGGGFDIDTGPGGILYAKTEDGAIQQVEGLAARGGEVRQAQIENPQPTRVNFQPDFPDIVVQRSPNSPRRITRHVDFEAAKAGDVEAAGRVVDFALDDAVVERVKAMAADHNPVLVAVHAEESTGRNHLPIAYASRLGDRLGLDVDTEIVQSNRVHRTGKGAEYRLTAQPQFSGPVEPGRSYIVVDDHVTAGGTLAALRSYIEARGGKVVGATTLTASPRSHILKPTVGTLAALRGKFPDLEPWFKEHTGYGFDALTESEARQFLRYGSADRVRGVLAEGEQTRRGGEADKSERAAPGTDADLGTPGTGPARRLVTDLDAGRLKPSVEQVANRYGLSTEEAANLLDEVAHRPDTPIELASRTVENPANPKHKLTTEDLAKFRWRKVSPDVRERRLREHDQYAQNVHGIARSDFANDADFVDALQDHMVASEMVRLRPIVEQAKAAGEEISLVEARDIEHATSNGANFEDALSDAKERAALRAEPRIVGGDKPQAAPDVPFTPRGQLTVAQRRPLPVPGSIQETIDAALRVRGRLVAGEGGGAGGGLPPVVGGAAEVPRSPQDIILSKISVGEHDAARPWSWSRFYTAMIDDLNPVKKAIEAVIGRAGYRELPVSENAYPLFRLSRGTFGKADEMLERGTFDFDTYETNGRGLRQILAPVRYDLNGLRAYATSKRALELEGRGITSGLDMAAAREVVAEGERPGTNHPSYEPIFRELVAYQDRLSEYLLKAGVISRKAFAAMKAANAEYVPFFRIMDETLTPGEGTGKGLNSRNPIKKIEGSERVIIDPIESIIKNTYAYIALAEKNAAGLKLVDSLFPTKKVRLLENTTVVDAGPDTMGVKRLPAPGETIIERIDEPTQQPVPAHITEFLSQHGLDKKLGPDLFAMVRTAGADEGHIIRVLRDGKPETYRVSEDLATAWRGLDQESTALWVRLLAGPTRMLKAGVTLDPSFAGRNAIRDFFAAAVNTTGAVFHPVNVIKGLMSVAGQDKFYRNWLKGGGANSALVSMDRRYLQEDVFHLNQETGVSERFWNSTVRTMREGEVLADGGAQHPLAGLRALSELIENATRVGEARKIMERQAAETGAAATKAEIQEAAYRSREVTLDFARIGAKTRAVNQIVAFFNPTLQSVDRLVREAAAHPVGFTAKATAWITTPSILLWWANQSDPRWKEIPRWQKDLAWIAMTDKWTDQGAATGADGQVDAYHRIRGGRLERNEGTIWRFPKPFELGLFFGSLPERILESYIADNPDAWKDFDKSITSLLLPSVVPTVAIPMVEQLANRSLFTGAPIVPGYAEKSLPEYQYTPYTSETAKALGHLMGAFPGLRAKSLEENSGIAGVARTLSTPALIDNYVRAWTGGLGQYAIGIADAGLRHAGVVPDNRPAPALSDIPFIKAFVVRYPSASAQSIADFYEGFAAQERVVTTYMERIKAGDVAGAGRIADWAPAGMLKLTGYQKTLGETAGMVRMIADNPAIPADEKRQLIDTAYFRMIEIAHAGNAILGAMKAAVETDRRQPKPGVPITGPTSDADGPGRMALTPQLANASPAAVMR